MIELTEYFRKSGFGDGEDAARLALGYAHRDRAVAILREELERTGLAVVAVAADVGTTHNPCRIDLEVDGEALDYEYGEWDADELEMFGLAADRLDRAIAAAARRFRVSSTS